jgi:hypothetical protein
MNRLKFALPLTKPAAIAAQLIGFALIIAAILRLLSGFSLGALALIVLGVWTAWEAGKAPRKGAGKNNN